MVLFSIPNISLYIVEYTQFSTKTMTVERLENFVRYWKKYQHFDENLLFIYFPFQEIMTRSEMAEKMFSSEKIM